jgi:hypothetical protein
MKMETKAYLIEEYNKNGDLVWKMISFFEPDSIQWMRDIRGKSHNLVISELGIINSKKINGIEKKYDSSKFVVGL